MPFSKQKFNKLSDRAYVYSKRANGCETAKKAMAELKKMKPRSKADKSHKKFVIWAVSGRCGK